MLCRCPCMENSLKLGGRNLHCQNLRLMLKISYADCLGLSPVLSLQFTLEMCAAACSRKKITRTPYFCGSRSFRVINVGTTGKVISSAVMIGSKSVSISKRSHARQANSGKIMISHPSLVPSLERNLLTQHPKFAHKKLKTLCYHMAKMWSLYLT